MARTHTLNGCMTAPIPARQTSLYESYLEAFRKGRSRRAAIAQLHALEDRLLHDIGISRSEIESVVHFAGRDPTRLRRD